MTTATISLVPSSPASVTDALESASRATGVDFDYLLKTAERESSLNPKAKSKTSSASGLFQFVDQTWLATLKAHGAEHGLSDAAAAIQQGPSGRLTVRDPARRQAIFSLREDPSVCSMMAAELTRDSRSQLEHALGRPVDDGELYLAHFFGASEAARFIAEGGAAPDEPAASSFPDAAAANPSVFYASDGSARSFAEVEARLTSLHESSPPVSPPPAQLAKAAAPAGDLKTKAQNLIARLGGGGMTEWLPQSAPLDLTPQVIEILSSLDPIPDSKAIHKSYGNLFASDTSF